MQIIKSVAIFVLFIAVTLTSAHADFYVLAGGGKKIGKEIKALPYTITEPGFYFITQNLTGSSGSHGITVQSSHVTIDLMGFSLVGPRSTEYYHGIYSESTVDNVKIRNGTIRDFVGSGYRSGSIGHQAINITAANNGEAGLHLGGKSSLVKDCIVFSNSGLGIYAGPGSTISGNTCYDNGWDGINTNIGSTIIGNTCRDNKDDGIYAGTGSSVIGNTCYHNTDHGIYLEGHSYAGQNTCYGNGTNMNNCPAVTSCFQDFNYAP